MECNVIKTDIELCKTAIDGFSEEKVDFDIVLPEYCSPASKIIKCEVVPSILNKRIEGEKLIFEGRCSANIVYADEDSGMIRCVSDTTEFVQTHMLKQKSENYRIRIKLRASNVVCRLQNSRRISVKSIIGIAIKVTGNANAELIDDFKNCAVESKFDIIECCTYKTSSETDIHINGEIQTDFPILEIIKTHSDIVVNDVKIIDGKAVIKGEARICSLYISGETFGDVHSVKAAIPFSEIAELEGAEEDDFCNVEVSVTGIRCSVDNGPEQNLINIEFDAYETASLYKSKKIKILRDAYSRDSELGLKSEDIVIESMADVLKFDENICEAVKLDTHNCAIDEVICKPLIKNISSLSGELIAEGEISVQVCAHNDEDYIISEKTIPFKTSKKLNSDYSQLRCEADLTVINCDYKEMSEGSIKIDCLVGISILVFEKRNLTVINDVEILSLTEKNKSKVVMYYADKGETLWDIAKKYSTSTEIIKRDNNLKTDTLENSCMLMICDN